MNVRRINEWERERKSKSAKCCSNSVKKRNVLTMTFIWVDLPRVRYTQRFTSYFSAYQLHKMIVSFFSRGASVSWIKIPVGDWVGRDDCMERAHRAHDSFVHKWSPRLNSQINTDVGVYCGVTLAWFYGGFPTTFSFIIHFHIIIQKMCFFFVQINDHDLVWPINNFYLPHFVRTNCVVYESRNLKPSHDILMNLKIGWLNFRPVS